MSIELAEERLIAYKRNPALMVRELFHVEPDRWQDEVLEDFPHCPRQAMAACKGPGKAQPVDTPIPTPDGIRRFGDLQVGDRVFAGDGSITHVTGVYERGELEVYRVSFDDGSDTLACAEHLWKIRGRTERRHNTWSILTTQQIIDRGVRERNGRWAGRHFEIPRQGALQLPHLDLPLHPYVLGVWLGDGVRNRGNYATKPRPEIQQRIETFGYRTRFSEATKLVTVYGMATLLRALQLFELYSRQRYVPEVYKFASIEQRTELLTGLMDTDGGIDMDGHTEFASTSEQLAHDIVWLVRSLGGIAFVKAAVKQPFYYSPDGKKILGHSCYRVTVRTPFNPFSIEAKRCRWRDPMASPSALRYMTRKLDSIELTGTALCRCISVAHPEQLYLTEDLIVTHNTAVLAWLAWNFLLTRPHPKIGAVSITGSNLDDNLWPEMSFWQKKSAVLSQQFEWTSKSIHLRAHPETWFMTHKTWRQSANAEELGQTLAGLWAEYVLFLLDEAGGIPVAIMRTAEAALQRKGTEGHIVMAGNTTSTEGCLYEAIVTRRHLWRPYEITADPDDPKRTPRISVDYARAQIAEYGRENPWVMINILAKFPSQGINQLISADQVRECLGRHLHPHVYDWAPKILGGDIADQGDDRTVWFPRQGALYLPPILLRKMDSVQVAGYGMHKASTWGADSIQVDATGGYGAGPSAIMRDQGFTVLPIQFSGEPLDPRFYNKRAEILWTCADHVKQGASLPTQYYDAGGVLHPLGELIAEFTTPTFSYKGDKIIIEPKESIKARLGRSPDIFEAAACTHAFPVATTQRTRNELFPFDLNSNIGKSKTQYDPLDRP